MLINTMYYFLNSKLYSILRKLNMIIFSKLNLLKKVEGVGMQEICYLNNFNLCV